MNLWFDHGTGIGGNLIDFGILYHRCPVKELLNKLGSEKRGISSFHPQPQVEIKETQKEEQKIRITDSREIKDPGLREYLGERKIPLIIANRYCSEVEFELYGKRYLAIGFKNNSGGYELRSSYFKGSSSPKDITSIKHGGEKLSVFEGFFDFLSFQVQQLSHKNLIRDLPKLQGDYLILNSISFFEKSRQLMEIYFRIQLFLDRDERGIDCTRSALLWSEKFVDGSLRYSEFKDLNESLIGQSEQELKKDLRLKPRF